jgi:hypothetical protein
MPAGRPKGAKNKQTLEREAHARAMLSLVTQALGGTLSTATRHAHSIDELDLTRWGVLMARKGAFRESGS